MVCFISVLNRSVDEEGFTTLSRACEHGSSNIVTYLIANGADVNQII